MYLDGGKGEGDLDVAVDVGVHDSEDVDESFRENQAAHDYWRSPSSHSSSATTNTAIKTENS